MKIIITGGIGYIGTELCKIYSGESRYNKIIVLDNRFASERVTQLRDWGIEYVHGDIRDKGILKNVIKDTNIIYHLAGITDVVNTKTEINNEKDKITKEVGVDASRYIIDLAPKKCKIIFPSTHVVYEGLENIKYGIKEDEPVKPVFSYSTGKVITENDLLQQDKNFVIVRLGTVHGYSSDTMRLNIMPNLFSKIASQNGTIKLFSGGLQYKSLVSVFDVVRCLKYLAENNKVNKEIFHCSSDNVTIKEVAEICKEFRPKLTIIETDDEIPNDGYTFSNEKLLNTGFEFKFGLKESIREMIDMWSSKTQSQELEMIIKGANEYIDKRGKIINYSLTEPINLIGYIESKAGTVRANHYHPIQEQKCLLIKGRYISVLKDLSKNNSVIQTNIINEGDLSIIPANVAHTMIFIDDSIFINLVRGERDHKNYGVTHTIPYKLVDEKLKKLFIYHYKLDCRVCKNKSLKQVVSLGMSPLANNLPKREEEEEELYPLELNYCPKCFNCQLSFVVPPEKMFDNYLYVSSTNKTFRKHFNKMASELIDEFALDQNSFVIDIGSNDGIFLSPLIKNNIKVLGVDPAKNICEIANNNGIETLHGYFNKDLSKKIFDQKGKADLITGFNVFAHTDNIKEFSLNVFDLLTDSGVMIIEVQYILDTIRETTFDNIYHEHVNYWSVSSLNRFFSDLGFQLFNIKHINTHGGSIRAYIGRKDEHKLDPSVNKFIKNEKTYGLNDFEIFNDFSKKIEKTKTVTLQKLNEIKKKNKKIVAYGSPAKATTLLNYYNITSEHIDYIIEDNELKHGHFLPGKKIPIVSKDRALKTHPDYILILAWNFFDSIISNNKKLVDAGSKFITFKDWN